MRAMSAAGANCEAGRRLSTLRALGDALRHTPGLITRPTVWALAAGLLGPGCVKGVGDKCQAHLDCEPGLACTDGACAT